MTEIDWTTTSLKSGAISSSCYSCNITDLEPNSIYEYRAYMVIGGVPHYGETYQISTLPIQAYSPIVSTGLADCVGENSMMICNNVVVDGGNTSINEYGVLYTQNSAFGTDNMLKYEMYPSFVCLNSKYENISTGTTYFTGSTCQIIGLESNTSTFYRAFAKNSSGCGYGIVKTQQTVTPDITSVDVCLNNSYVTGTNNSIGFICTNPSLGASQYVIANICMLQCVVNSGCSTTQIFCKPDSGLTYCEIYCCETSPSLNIKCTPIKIKYGDEICWSHCTNGDTGSYSTILLNNIIVNSEDITPTISPSYYCDRIEVID